jgi:thymidylate kinase
MCGKTEIAQALSERLGIPVYKSGREHDLFHDKDSQYLTLKYGNWEMIKLLETTGASVIFDRFFPSEWVYSQVYDRTRDLDLVMEYDRYWASLGGKIIWLDKPEMDGKDELIEKSKYNEIRRKYEQYMSLTSCEVFHLDTTNRNLEEQVNKIYDFIKE